MSNNPYSSEQRQQTFKRVDVGQRVLLNDQYLLENHKSLQLEAIALKTMQHAEDSARQLLDAAREEAQQIIAAAREKAIQIVEHEGIQKRDAFRQEAYEEGFQAGLKEGYLQIAQEAADKVAMAELIVQKAFEAQALITRKQLEQTMALLEYILKLVLAHELQTTPAQILGLIEKAAQQIEYTGTARVIVNPETLHLLKSFSEETMAALSELHHIRFHPDPGCAPYELYLETVESAYNISPENQAEIYLKTVAKLIEFGETPEPAPVLTSSAVPEEVVEMARSQSISAESTMVQSGERRITGMLVPAEDEEDAPGVQSSPQPEVWMPPALDDLEPDA